MKKTIPLMIAAFALFSGASAMADTRVIVVKPRPVVVHAEPVPVYVTTPALRAVAVVHPAPAVHVHAHAHPHVVKRRTVTSPLGHTRTRTVVR